MQKGRRADVWNELFEWQNDIRKQNGYTAPQLLHAMGLPRSLKHYLYSKGQVPSRKRGTRGRDLRDGLQKLRANNVNITDAVSDAERVQDEYYVNMMNYMNFRILNVEIGDNTTVLVTAIDPGDDAKKEIEAKIADILKEKYDGVNVEVRFIKLYNPRGAHTSIT